MTIPVTQTSLPPRRLLRSIGAVFLGFIVIVVLSLCTDEVLHVLKIYPPWGEPMYDTRLNLLALGYRSVYGVLGSYITARVAPYSPMRHALIGGAIGFVLSTVGAIVAMSMADLGPKWYPITLALTALPGAWLGGVLHRKWHAER